MMHTHLRAGDREASLDSSDTQCALEDGRESEGNTLRYAQARPLSTNAQRYACPLGGMYGVRGNVDSKLEIHQARWSTTLSKQML